jgi:uncharacterized tellurite resistance protein B-like protein
MSYLIYESETDDERVYPLKIGLNKIGRQSDNDIVVENSSVSRYHAKIHVDLDKAVAVINDLNSLNHTFVNGTKINQFVLQEGDIVSCGKAHFKFTYASNIENNSAKNEEFQITIPVGENFNSEQNLCEKQGNTSVIKSNSQNQQQRITDKLKILLEVSKQLCSPEEPRQMLAKILGLLFKIMNIDRGAILLVNEESQQLELKAVKSIDGVKTEQHFYSQNIVNSVSKTGEAILTANAMQDSRFELYNSVISSSIHASMCVPLKLNNQIIGVLYVDNLSVSAVYSDEDLEFLEGLANQAAAAIHMAKEFDRQKQELKQQIAQLQIQIDPDKRERDVAEIVESDFFQEIQAEAKRLRH